MLITSAKEVMFSGCLFVCLLAGLCQNYLTDFHKIWWNGGTWPWKKQLDFGGSKDCVNVSVKIGST